MRTAPDAALTDLLTHLELESRADDVFRGHSQVAHNGRVYGGMVFAQALRAAQSTVEARKAHSAHAYFLRPGDPERPIDYRVERIREGRNFNTRRVTADQGGQAIFTLTASFHVDEPSESRQVDITIPAEPVGEEYEDGILRALHALDIEVSREQFGIGPVQIRVEDGLDMMLGKPRPPALRCWMRSRGVLPDDPGLHTTILAWVSDLTIIVPSVHPLDFRIMSPGVQSASLDHAIWIHDAFRMDDWIYAVHDSPVLKGSRALGRVLYYSRDGRLVASAVQEGLIRRS